MFTLFYKYWPTVPAWTYWQNTTGSVLIYPVKIIVLLFLYAQPHRCPFEWDIFALQSCPWNLPCWVCPFKNLQRPCLRNFWVFVVHTVLAFGTPWYNKNCFDTFYVFDIKTISIEFNSEGRFYTIVCGLFTGSYQSWIIQRVLWERCFPKETGLKGYYMKVTWWISEGDVGNSLVI